MAKPFVFHFSRGAGRTPRGMVVVDLQADCALCGYEEIQRFYHGVPFHSLGLPTWRRLIQRCPQRLAYPCSNCGQEVLPSMCRRGALTYGMADGSGLIQSFFPVREGQGHSPTHQLDPQRSLDPQALPQWEPDAQDARERHEALDEELLFHHLGRLWSFKAAWRELLQEAHRSREAQLEEVAPGAWLAAASDRASLTSLLDAEPELQRGSLLRCDLLQRPQGLAWLGAQQALHGAPAAWLPPELLPALRQGSLVAVACLDATPALEVLTQTLTRGRLEFTQEGQGPQAVISQIKTPRDIPWSGRLSLRAILQHAAHTAISPGDAARLAAEEVVAELLGLTLQSI